MKKLIFTATLILMGCSQARADVSGSASGSQLSLGGEARETYERYAQGVWAHSPDNADGYWLERYLLHARVAYGEDFFIYGELQSALQKYRNGGSRPSDADNLDVEQLYANAKWQQNDVDSLAVEAGRQELFFGSGRFVANRDLPGARQAFDLARLTEKAYGATIDVFGGRPVLTSPGTFDNHADLNQSFWGVYGVRPLGNSGMTVDLYYLGARRDNALYALGPGRETRDMPGVRLWGKREAYDYDSEVDYQFGNFNAKSVQAWSVANEVGCSFDGAYLKPRAFLRFGAISGNSDPRGSVMATFWPMFPRGQLLDFSGLIGPQNLMAFEPGVDLYRSTSLHLILASDFYWRESPNDGVYNMPGVLVAAPSARRALFIGGEPEIKAIWNINAHLSTELEYSHYFPGDFIRESGLTREIDYLAERATLKF